MSVPSNPNPNAAIKSNDDCYFYYYSSCTKGDLCPFRHEPLALANEVVCNFWKSCQCAKAHCPFRHLDVADKKRNVTKCYFEGQPGGCRKPHCPFLHEGIKLQTNTATPQVMPTTGKIIVNKNKINDIVLPVGSLPVQPKPKPSALTRLGPKAPQGLSVKDRLGYKTRSRLEEETENVEVFECDSEDEVVDSEEEELRLKAVKTLDLRKRLTVTATTAADKSEDNLEDEEYMDEFRSGEIRVLSVVKKAKKAKKEKKEKKKNKKEKKEKKSKKALVELNESAEDPHRRIVTRLSSPGKEDDDTEDVADDAELSLADRVAAMRDRQFAATSEDLPKLAPRMRMPEEGDAARDVDLRDHHGGSSGRSGRKRRKDDGSRERRSPKSKRRSSSSSRRRSESEKEPSAKKKKSPSKSSRSDDKGRPKSSSKAIEEDLIETEKLLKEIPEVNKTVDVMKELDELLQD